VVGGQAHGRDGVPFDLGGVVGIGESLRGGGHGVQNPTAARVSPADEPGEDERVVRAPVAGERAGVVTSIIGACAATVMLRILTDIGDSLRSAETIFASASARWMPRRTAWAR
jgi:hypothetical protein